MMKKSESWSGTFKKYVWEVGPLMGWTKEQVQDIMCEVDVTKLEPENGGFERAYVPEFRLAGVRCGWDPYDVRSLVHGTINEIFSDHLEVRPCPP